MATTTSPKARIALQFAVQKALQYCKELFPTEASNFLLEEVEYSESEEAWLITIGFDIEKPPSAIHALMSLAGSNLVRQYKKVKINGHTGEPLSLHIRKLD
jgi:hypothetical protein